MKNGGELFVHYGCGLCAPETWLNYDASPSLRIQHLPLVGHLLARRFGLPQFPANVRYGNIVNGLPLAQGSCTAVYCSHILEHLSFEDSLKALQNTYELLEAGGVFRIVVPDLEYAARNYLASSTADASEQFMKYTRLGTSTRPKTLAQTIRNHFGHSRHLWMWDKNSLTARLKQAGFKSIRTAKFGDSNLDCFRDVEDEGRWNNAVGIECIK